MANISFSGDMIFCGVPLEALYYASLLLASEVPLKQFQEWLGHSDMSIMANNYSRIDSASKNATARVMEEMLVE